MAHKWLLQPWSLSVWPVPDCVLIVFVLAVRCRNVIHGSDSVISAQKEISLWFRQSELQCWEDSSSAWIYNWCSKSPPSAPPPLGEAVLFFCFHVSLSLQDGSHCTSEEYFLALLARSLMRCRVIAALLDLTAAFRTFKFLSVLKWKYFRGDMTLQSKKCTKWAIMMPLACYSFHCSFMCSPEH